MSLSVRLVTALGTNSIVRKGAGKYKKVRANGSDLFLTAGVTKTGETAGNPDVDLAAVGEVVFGIITGTADSGVDLSKDADSPYADNTWLMMYIPDVNDEVYMTILSATVVTEYTRIGISAGFIAPFTYADGTSITDTTNGYVGIALEAGAGATATEYIILVQWRGN